MEQRSIQSIEIGAQLLRALVDRGVPCSLGQLARDAGMSSARAHPYMVSFCKVGLTQQDPLSSRYELGPFALQMGLISFQVLDPVRIAVPEISTLSAALELTVALAVMGTHGPTVVYIQEAHYPVHMNMRKGAVMSLFNTATGRLFSAHLPGPEVERLMARERQDDGIVAGAFGDRPDPATLTALLEEVRQQGLGRTIDTPTAGIHAMSAPVFDHTGTLVLAVTVIGPKGLFDPDWDGAVATPLRACAARISARLGHAPRR
jgi:DNA-binding IclR family transcriptional regulator